MSAVINSSVFPGIQGGPLEHCIAAKAVAFNEALTPEFTEYQKRVVSNARKLAEELSKRGYNIVSGGTDNHLFLIDLRSKFPNLTGKQAETALVYAGITVNKNMVPYDSRSPFQTSGIRIGTPAITTRGFNEQDMVVIAAFIDEVLNNYNNEEVLLNVKQKVAKFVEGYKLFEC